MRLITPMFGLLAISLSVHSTNAQLWDTLTNPRAAVSLRHPPGLGINVKRVAFGPASGTCSDLLIDGLTERFVEHGIEVIDRRNLDAILREHNFSISGYVDKQSAAELGKILGPAILVFVKVQRCTTERQPLYENVKGDRGRVVRVFISRTRAYLQGSFQAVDLATARIFSAQTFDHTPIRENKSPEGRPEFPSSIDVQNEALHAAGIQGSRMFVPWTETRELVFFDDKECGLKTAHSLLKSGDIEGALAVSAENLESCKILSSKPKVLAHAYYNVGLLQMTLRDFESARSNLQESAKLRAGSIVSETLAECARAEELEARMQRVEDRTIEIEQNRESGQEEQANEATPQTEPLVEDRLKKLKDLYEKGLIKESEYEAKRAQILKDL